MSTETAEVQISTEQKTETAEVQTQSPFSKGAWNETIPEDKVEDKTNQPFVKTEIKEEKPEEKEEFLDANVYLKNKWGFENEEDADTQIKTLREKASKEPEEIKFDNDESKRIYELLKEGKPENKKAIREALQIQEQIEELTSITDVNKDNAEDIIKLQIRLANKTLSSKEVDFEYKLNFVASKEPVQKATEDEDDFKERHDEWKEQVAMVEMRRIVAAKKAQPELLKLKTEIVFPELIKPIVQTANEPDPIKVKEARDYFLNKLESDYSKVEGFTTQVKDESVEIPISFKIPDEQRIAIKGRLQEGLDVNEFIDSRWFSEKGEPKIEQIMSDIYQLENLDKILSGVANESANQRLLALRKQATNTDLKNTTNQNTFQPNADGKSNVSPFKQGAWSEKQPVLT